MKLSHVSKLLVKSWVAILMQKRNIFQMIKERDWDFCASTISMAFCVTGIEWALLNIMVSLSPKVIIWRLLALSSFLWKILWETSRLCAELLLLLFNLGEIDMLIHLNHARGKPPLVGVLFSLSMDATFKMQSPSTFFTHYQHLFPRRLILRMDTVELCRHFRSVFHGFFHFWGLWQFDGNSIST